MKAGVPMMGGVGAKMMAKMGWREGEGLGKDRWELFMFCFILYNVENWWGQLGSLWILPKLPFCDRHRLPALEPSNLWNFMTTVWCWTLYNWGILVILISPHPPVGKTPSSEKYDEHILKLLVQEWYDWADRYPKENGQTRGRLHQCPQCQVKRNQMCSKIQRWCSFFQDTPNGWSKEGCKKWNFVAQRG